MLLLHSWWGLTPFFRRLADRLAERGYTVLAPDLNEGETFIEADDARDHLASLEPDRLAALTLTSAGIARDRSVDPRAPIAIVGFSMGASLGLWASVRAPEHISKVAAFYGVQSIDFAGSASSYQLHLADDDPLVPEDDAAFMEATMGMESLAVEVHRYPGTSHFFFEGDQDEYDEEAARLAWARLLDFLGA